MVCFGIKNRYWRTKFHSPKRFEFASTSVVCDYQRADCWATGRVFDGGGFGRSTPSTAHLVTCLGLQPGQKPALRCFSRAESHGTSRTRQQLRQAALVGPWLLILRAIHPSFVLWPKPFQAGQAFRWIHHTMNNDGHHLFVTNNDNQ